MSEITDAVAQTRDALHADTLRLLAVLPMQFGHYGDRLTAEEGKLLAYAAECVTRVPELEAEVERLRAYERFVAALDLGDITQVIPKPGLRHGCVRVWDRAGECFEGTDTLAAYAAATREGTDA